MPAEAVPAPTLAPAAAPAPAVAPVVPVIDPKAPPAAAAPPEPKVEPAKPEPRKPVGAEFARLARAEQQRVAKEQAAKAEIAAERAKLDAERAEIEKSRAEAKEARETLERAKSDPGYLEKIYGPDWYEKLTEYRLAGNKPPPDLAVRAVEERMEGRLSAFERKQEEDRKREIADRQKRDEEAKSSAEAEKQRVIEAFHAETVEFVKAHAEEYELTSLYEQHDLVPQVIEEHHRATGKILSAKEAADLVEKHLEEQVVKAEKSKRLGGRFAKPAPAPEPPPKPAPTLSNGSAATPSFVGPPKNEDERLARAMAAMDARAARAAAS